MRTRISTIARRTAAWLIFCLWATLSPAQIPTAAAGILAGTVRDSETGAPIENVNVYVANSTLGCVTDSAGAFRLRGLPIGVLDIVVSRLGFERQITRISHLRPDSARLDVRLIPAVLTVGEVEVGASSPEDWKDNLEQFRKAFIGKGELADLCAIVNPEVLSFSLRGDTLSARTDSILRVHNLALGYDLSLAMIVEFTWDLRLDCGEYLVAPRFDPLTPRSPEEERSWSERRAHAHKGSLTHFLQTLYAGTSASEAFFLQSGPLKKLQRGGGHAVSPSDITLTKLQASPLAVVRFPGYLRIQYGLEADGQSSGVDGRDGFGRPLDEPAAGGGTNNVSVIWMNSPSALIDSLGNLFDPLSIQVSGAWAQRRAWMLLPLDYMAPPGN